MTIWTKNQENVDLDDVEVSDKFWDSEYGRVAGEKGCLPLAEALKLFLAAEYGYVLSRSRDFDMALATVNHNWPKEWR
jgi:hypothetical protein